MTQHVACSVHGWGVALCRSLDMQSLSRSTAIVCLGTSVKVGGYWPLADEIESLHSGFMTRLLNCLGIASVIAAIVIGLLQRDLPYTGRVAVISVRTRTLSEGSLPELPVLLCAHRGCVDGSKCAICAIIPSLAVLVPAGPISGCFLVRPVPAGHLSSWCCPLQGLP